MYTYFLFMVQRVQHSQPGTTTFCYSQHKLYIMMVHKKYISSLVIVWKQGINVNFNFVEKNYTTANQIRPRNKSSP